MTELLLNTPPLIIQKELAVAIGSLEQAMVLQQLHFLSTVQEKNDNQYVYRDNHWWVYNSYRQWNEDHFPFWSESKIGRIFRDLEKRGLIIAEQFGKGKGDQRKWYRINHAKLDNLIASYESESCIVPDCNDASCQVDTIMSETTTEKDKDSKESLCDETHGEADCDLKQLRSDLAVHFKKKTGIPFPVGKGRYKALNRLWWCPLLEIATLCEYDSERTKKLIDWTVIHLDTQGMTVNHPLSIKGTAIGEQARRKRTNGQPRRESGAAGRDSGQVFPGLASEHLESAWERFKRPEARPAEAV